MVDTEVPATVVQFLLRTLPTKTKADLYTSIGLQKQGKSEFYRDFLHHLQHSSDKFIIAPGIKGMVMSVFTLPSYPFVFKVINDRFDIPACGHVGKGFIDLLQAILGGYNLCEGIFCPFILDELQCLEEMLNRC